MLLENFKNGNNQTVGIELELRLLDKDDLSLRGEYSFIEENISSKYKKNIAPEFLSSMLEINTPVFNHAYEINNYLYEIIDEIKKVAKKRGIVLATSGAYSLSNKDAKVSAKDRYEKIYNEHKILLDDFTICGLHIHVGFENFDEALKAFNFSLKYLPLFVALSASSSFYNNSQIGIHSYRTKIFDRLPKASIPEYFDTYDQMNELYEILYKNEVIKTGKDVWWDMRIQPNFKTLEFRVCDAVSSIERIEVIVALLKGLCKLSKIKKTTKLPMQILKQNMWSATRYSMVGEFISNEGKKSIKEALNDLALELDSYNFLDSKEKVFELISQDSISQQMEKVYNKSKNIKDIEKLGVFK